MAGREIQSEGRADRGLGVGAAAGEGGQVPRDRRRLGDALRARATEANGHIVEAI
jgi:hypothetical protein